jgi:peptidoglycan/LPS O-acetylase OafA/YrhL
MNAKSNKIIYYLLLVGTFFLYINTEDHTSFFIDYDKYSLIILTYFILFTLFVNHKLGFIVSKATIFFGKISFALYLIHQHIGRFVLINLMVEKWCFNYIGALIIAFIIVVGLATAITFYVEIPVGKKLNGYLRKQLKLPLKVKA